MSLRYNERETRDSEGTKVVQSRGWPVAWEVRTPPAETRALPNALWTETDWYVINVLLDAVLWLFMLGGAAAVCEWLARRGKTV
jgi:hypothetical protein